MLDYYITATVLCQTCMNNSAMNNDAVLGTTGNIMTPCAMCGREGADHKVVLLFDEKGIMPGNGMLMAQWEGK